MSQLSAENTTLENVKTVNITVVTQNRLALTRVCLESLLPTLRDGMYVTVVDNGSTDGTPEYLDVVASGNDRVSVVTLPRNMGVAIAANCGWAFRDTDYYLKLDNDMQILAADWLERLLDVMENAPEVGMAGYRFFDKHEVRPVTLSSGHAFLRSSACGGGCALIPRRVHEVCGFWCEDYGRYGHEDVDYNNRVMQKGFAIGYLDGTERTIRHLGYEGEVDQERESVKLRTRTNDATGEKLYLINKFLFESGIRDLNVPRKYLPDCSEGGIRFRLQDTYRPLMQLQQELLRTVPYSVEGDTVSLDFNGFLEKLGGRR